ncbi:methionine adenosyltransferase [Chitinophaga polysaccharea]|uniref:methionine adenosyltransferase n=1 Tax=Chitinophaga polysaccharea TaxID=1293035 RepID=UPI0011AB02CC|nr:methionine adenosyltransferase [Chitinophaga polysaccharea]
MDDGQVGRGNRLDGLITPYRPVSLEVSAGKNQIGHVGKIYSLFAFELSKANVTNALAEEASVYIVSQIGKPINQPQLLDIRLKNQSAHNTAIEEFVQAKLDCLPTLWKIIINSKKNYVAI